MVFGGYRSVDCDRGATEMEAGMLKPIDRDVALRALWNLVEEAFGHDKGSGEAYEYWAAENKLCDEWDGESEISDNQLPPSVQEILVAAGINPQELYGAIGINPHCFESEMLLSYGCEPLKVTPEERKHWDFGNDEDEPC
jgi:hypothetical protein